MIGSCPNLSHPTYKQLVDEYGETAAYVASSLFDSPKFQAWKGDDEIPTLANGNVSSNSGDTFSISRYLENYLQKVQQGITQTPEQFNLYNAKSANYEMQPNGQLSFRPKQTHPQYQKPHTIDHVTEKYVRDLAERLKSKFGVDYEVITDPSKFWAGKFENGVATINLSYASQDTPFHEFAHPFVETIRRTNPALYQSLRDELVQEGSILRGVKQRYPELLGDALVSEAITQAIGEYATGSLTSPSLIQKIKELLSQIADYLGELFHSGYILPAELPATLTLRQLGELLNSDIAIPVLTYEGLEFQKIKGYEEKQKRANDKQSKTLRTLFSNSQNVTLEEVNHTYTDQQGISYTPVSTAKGTTWTKPKPLDKDGNEIKSPSLIWGTQADSILSAIVDKVDIPETPNIHTTARQQLIDYFTQVVNDLSKDGNILVTQAVVSDSDARIAGSTDLIVIKQDGNIDIYDLKTSQYYTSKPNERATTDYDREFTGNEITRSKRGEHQAQLSLYKALAQDMGLRVDNLAVIPVKINPLVKGSIVTSIETEPLIPVIDDAVTTTNLLNAYRKANKENESTGQKDYSSFVDKLKILLQKQIDKFENTKTVKTDNSSVERATKLKSLLGELANVNAVKSVSKVIDAIHSELVDGTDSVTSYAQKFDGLVSRIPLILARNQANEIGLAVKNLNTYLDYVNGFDGLQELLDMYGDSVKAKTKVDPDSPLAKLRQILDTRDAIKSGYQEAVKPLMARILSEQISPAAQQSAIEYLQIAERHTTLMNQAISANKTGQAAKHQEIINKTKAKFESLATDEDKLLMQLTSSTADMGIFEYLTDTMAGNPDTILGLFFKKIKAIYYRVDEAMNSLQREAVKEFEIFKKATGRNQNNPEEFNKGLFETVTRYHKNDAGEWIAIDEKHFVQALDINRYNKSYKEMIDQSFKAEQQAIELNDRKKPEDQSDNAGSKARNKVMFDWFAANTTPLNEEERNKIIDEKKDLLARGAITKQEFQEWKRKNIKEYKGVITYAYDLVQPNPLLYKSSAFAAIQANPAMKRYYDYLIKLHFESQTKYPIAKELGYKLPSVAKEEMDIIREKGGLKHTAKSYVTDMLFKTARDEDRYNEYKIVPTYFTHFMPANQVTSDLLAASLRFAQSTTKYEAVVGSTDIQGIEEEAKALLNIFREREIHQTNSSNQRVIKDAAKKLGLTDAVIDSKGGHYAAFLEHFIDQNLYGKGEDKIVLTVPKQTIAGKEFGGQTIDVGKTVNSFMLLASIPALGGPFTLLKAIANKLNAEYNVIQEAFAGQHFDFKAYAKGTKRYDKWLVRDLARDYSAPIAQSLEGQLMDLYSPMQGHFQDHFGKEITWSAAKRIMQPGTWFFGQNAGEHSTQNKMFFAMMEHYQVKQHGKMIPLIDAYELNKEGVLQLKEGVEFTTRDKDAFTNKIHAINKQLHGIYNKMDKSVAQKNAFGRLAFMYRKYLIPAVKRRWGDTKMDQELGETVEGFHRTLIKTAMNDFQELISYYLRRKTKLTKMEQANIRRATFELVSMLVFSGLIMTMIGMRKHDDKLKKHDSLVGYVFNSSLYEIMRMNSEIQAFIPLPGIGLEDALRTITSPSAANSTLQKLAKFVSQLTTNPFETYDKKNKYYDKGESKLKTDFLSLLGVNSTNPVRAQEQFNKLY